MLSETKFSHLHAKFKLIGQISIFINFTFKESSALIWTKHLTLSVAGSQGGTSVNDGNAKVQQAEVEPAVIQRPNLLTHTESAGLNAKEIYHNNSIIF